MVIYQLFTLLWDEDEDGYDFSHDATFTTPELAQQYVVTELSEGPYRWRHLTCGRSQRSRWIALVPRAKRRRDGWAGAFVIDQDEIDAPG